MPKGKIEQVDSTPAILWDVAGMITLYGAVFGIEATREEISLLFACKTVRRGQREETVTVSDRVIMGPFTAKRLLVLLEKIVASQQVPFVMDISDVRTFIETSN